MCHRCGCWGRLCTPIDSQREEVSLFTLSSSSNYIISFGSDLFSSQLCFCFDAVEVFAVQQGIYRGTKDRRRTQLGTKL